MGIDNRKRFAPLALTAAAAGSLVLGLSATGTLSAFTAGITNSTNTSSTGSLVLQETSGSPVVTCTSTDANSVNASTCSTINKYGGTALVPGGSVTTSVTFKNIGSVGASSFTLAPGACTKGTVSGAPFTGSGDPCADLNLVVSQAGTQVFTGSLTAFAAAHPTLATLASNGSSAFSFVVSLPSSAGNTDQGLTVSQPMTWTLTS